MDHKERRTVDRRHDGERSAIMLNSAPVSISFFNNRLELIDCNMEAVRLFGLTSKKDYCRNFFLLMPPIQPNGRSSKQFIREYVREAFDKGRTIFEFICQKLDGTLIPTEVTLVRVEHKGSFVVVGYSRNLIDVYEAMEGEREAHQRAHILMESIPLGIELWNTNMEILDCNKQIVDMFGFMDKQIYLRRVRSNWGNNMLSSIFFKKAIEDGFSRYEWNFARIDGKPLHCEVRMHRVFIRKQQQIVVYYHDLSGIIAATEYAAEAENRASIMLNSTPLACFMLRENMTVIDCNKAALELFGFTNKDDAATRFLDIFPKFNSKGESVKPPEDLSWVEKTQTERFEFLHQTIKGEPIDCEIIFSHVNYQSEKVIACYFRDLREIKAMISQMKRIEIAEEESRAKSKFLARMSHEIRTPMNAIMGITNIQLLKSGHSQEMYDALQHIQTSSNTLLSIINDILDLSKIEAGKMEIYTKPYETASLIFDTVQLNAMQIGSKRINMVLKVDENIPTILYGDELRIKQVLNNIISNAIKYTAQGEVRTKFSMSRFGENMLEIEVEDTGRGMTDEQLNSLFSDEYMRFNETDNRIIQGTGLGMNITNELVNKMGGTIDAKSTTGVGTCFVIRIPQAIKGDSVLGQELAESLQNFQTSGRSFKKRHNFDYEQMPYGKVLVVDDVESNIYVAKGLLLPYGINVDTASSGYEALELIRKGNVYDIIFMDHMMPDMDGIETAKQIYSEGYKKPIVALTANTIIGQEELFINNGFSGFISKPIDVTALNNHLIRLIKNEYPDDIKEAAKRLSPIKQEVSIAITESFLRDAKHSLEVFKKLRKCPVRLWNDDDLKHFTIHIHGIKSALTNIGKTSLKEVARYLEESGRNKNINSIEGKFEYFIEDLREVVNKLEETVRPTKYTENENKELLIARLSEIKEFCIKYKKKSARNILKELNKSLWTKETSIFLKSLSKHLLHSAFEEAAQEIEVYCENINH